jgi:hypothetical protein
LQLGVWVYKGIVTGTGGPPIISFEGRIGSLVLEKFTTTHGVIVTGKESVALRDEKRLFVFIIYTSYDPTMWNKPAVTVS